MGIGEYAATDNGTYTTSCIWYSSVNKRDKCYGVVRNRWSSIGISTGVRRTCNEKGDYFLQGHVVPLSRKSANASLLWQLIGHPSMFLRVRLPCTSLIRQTFACYFADGTPAVISREFSVLYSCNNNLNSGWWEKEKKKGNSWVKKAMDIFY